jgi:folate-binding protein YgfZ
MGLDFSLPSSRLAQLRRGAVAVVEEPAVFRVEGSGALTCLQGLLTSDLAGPGDGAFVYGALLTPKGMIIVDPWVAREGERFTLLAPRNAHAATVELFKRSLPPRLARVTDLSDTWRVAWLLGLTAAERLARNGGPVLPGAGKSLRAGDLLLACGTPVSPFTGAILGPSTQLGETIARFELAGGRPGTEADLAAARILAGWPTLGREIDDRSLPQEVRFDELGAVSYVKGCYTGQETVARVHFRGHVNRTLRGVVFPGGEPLVERTLLAAGKEVGQVRTGLALDDRVLALGMVRHEVPDGTTVTAGGRPARVVALPLDAEQAGH